MHLFHNPNCLLCLLSLAQNVMLLSYCNRNIYGDDVFHVGCCETLKEGPAVIGVFFPTVSFLAQRVTALRLLREILFHNKQEIKYIIKIVTLNDSYKRGNGYANKPHSLMPSKCFSRLSQRVIGYNLQSEISAEILKFHKIRHSHEKDASKF